MSYKLWLIWHYGAQSGVVQTVIMCCLSSLEWRSFPFFISMMKWCGNYHIALCTDFLKACDRIHFTWLYFIMWLELCMCYVPFGGLLSFNVMCSLCFHFFFMYSSYLISMQENFLVVFSLYIMLHNLAKIRTFSCLDNFFKVYSPFFKFNVIITYFLEILSISIVK